MIRLAAIVFFVSGVTGILCLIGWLDSLEVPVLFYLPLVILLGLLVGIIATQIHPL